MSPALPASLTALHRRRLREIWRSAGWPCQDMVEVELLAAGLLERRSDANGRETLRVSDAGIAVLAATLQKKRAVRGRHEALVARLALQLQCAGRIAWRGLSLRSRVADAERAQGHHWQVALPDVFSVRHTTLAGYLQPAVHGIKVRRAIRLSDLRQADEVPAECGVMFAVWLALAGRPAG